MSDVQSWYFTFGFAHKHPRTGESLANCYTVVSGTNVSARAMVYKVFGYNWAFQYPTADGAGVTMYKLKYIPCVSYSPGELLPPSPGELDHGEWKLSTVNLATVGDNVEAFEQVYYPTVTELNLMIQRYNIPSDARIEYSECGSHAITVVWNAFTGSKS